MLSITRVIDAQPFLAGSKLANNSNIIQWPLQRSLDAYKLSELRKGLVEGLCNNGSKKDSAL